MQRSPDFIEFSQSLFLRPKTFFREYFTESERPPYFFVVMTIFSLGCGLDRVSRTTATSNYLDNWISYWFFALLIGFISGLLWYAIGGWFYHKRLEWSKGTTELNLSRNLFLFSTSISCFSIIFVTLISFLLKERPSADVSIYTTILFFIILMFFHIYSTVVSYYGVTSVTDVEKSKAKFWFLIIPISIYSLVYIYTFIRLHPSFNI